MAAREWRAPTRGSARSARRARWRRSSRPPRRPSDPPGCPRHRPNRTSRSSALEESSFQPPFAGTNRIRFDGSVLSRAPRGTPVLSSLLSTIEPMPSTARYDGVAAYYDENLREFTLAASETLVALLGPGPGRVLDLGCGSGLHFETLHTLGWSITGIDASVDQLRIARDRAGKDVELVRGDAADLPFEDRSFGAVTAVFVHTDIGDYPAVLAEAARVLQPGGRLVHLGLHPCFTGPFSRYQ